MKNKANSLKSNNKNIFSHFGMAIVIVVGNWIVQNIISSKEMAKLPGGKYCEGKNEN